MRIGELASAAGVSTDTVRYYERIGLLPSEGRTASNYRDYGPDAARRLRFIRRARDMGFRLSEIEELLAFGEDPDGLASDVRAATQRRIDAHRAEIAKLERLAAGLEAVASECEGEGPTESCPILAHFFADGEAQGAADAQIPRGETQ